VSRCGIGAIYIDWKRHRRDLLLRAGALDPGAKGVFRSASRDTHAVFHTTLN
jgi:hypothetical protein